VIPADPPTAPLLRRDLRQGVAVGLVLGIVLAVVVVLGGFVEWTQTMWSFVFIAAVALLPLALGIRLCGHAVWRLSQRGIPRERHTQAPAHMLSLMAPFNLAGAAAIVAYLVLLATFIVGDGGRTSPF
jgi:lysylphosphatidylglycerol synthetase-like protein (DUF2156 family)